MVHDARVGGRESPAAAALVEVVEAVAVGLVDEDRAGPGDVEAALDDRRGEEDVGRAGDEREHHLLQFRLREPAVGDADRGPGHDRPQGLEPGFLQGFQADRTVGFMVTELLSRITVEPGKRSGKPCIRGLRITVSDVLEYLASGMTEADILADFPELTTEDIRACLALAAERERRLLGSVA